VKASLNRWFGRAPDISAVVTRFPIAVALMAIFTLIIIVFDNFGDNEPLGRMLAGLIIGAYLAFCITIAREAKGKSPAYFLQIGLAILLAVITWFSKELRFNLPMAIGAVLLILGNMVIWRKTRDDLHVWDFTHKIWTGAAFATVGSIIFTVGVFTIGAALKSLFGLNIKSLIEHLILPIGLGFLAPLYWLSTAPQTDESYQELYDNPGFVSKTVAFMGTWLLSPLTLIYALILIAYGVKIILAGSLPKGEIAQLTTPFLIVGTLTWLVLEPPFIQTKVLAKLFRKLWFLMSIPAAILLAISIGVRIAEYGFTPERIALLMAVIGALGLGVWFSVGPKDKRDIRLIPSFIALLLGIGAFGAETLSVSNQKSRAISGLKMAGIISEDGVVLPLSDIQISDKNAARQAKGSLIFLKRHREMKILNQIFDGAEDAPDLAEVTSAELFKRLGLENIGVNEGWNSQRKISYSIENRVIDIAKYDKLYGPFSYYSADSSKGQPFYNKGDFKLTGSNYVLKFVMDGDAVKDFDIRTWVESLPKTDGTYILEKNPVLIYEGEDRVIAIRVDSIEHWGGGAQNENQINTILRFSVLTSGF